MAEFKNIMRDWKRLCKAFTTEIDKTCCDNCPIMALDYDEHGCDAIFSDWANNAKWEDVEQTVIEWAKENPEPVYPMWAKWLERNVDGVDADSIYEAWHILCTTRIPAEIAEKLGIAPKVYNNDR